MKVKWTVVLVLLFAGAGFYFGCNRVKNMKTENQRKVDSLNLLITSRGEVIREALADRQTFLDSVAVLNSLNDDLASDYTKLKKRMAQTVAVAAEVPPDTAYQALQDIYPDAAEKPYPFSPLQIKSIYIDVISSSLKDSLIISLERRTSLYGAEIILQRAVIREDSIAISNLEFQVTDFRGIVDLKDDQLASRDKKLRQGKFIKAGIGVMAFIAGVLAGK